ncbi:DUF1697 domain-containing protein [Sinomonas sp. ASV486]|uniref:DUF1697 domain-containing protein n=1 Tax=Sinomonas sp. ASV486 TaxID=3051170 RepID=UPI0027DE4C36|nr:DUF1697 domain-containing protein [Sinomonas sp. ASV486]MDQ4490650.1 DUF1697 domain-containing protein [Sinomonas sp. ASV486]
MAEYAVFLRGVNVGGITLKMADVRATLAALPVSGVKTLLASGNAVLSAEKTTTEVKDLVERALRSDFGYDAWVVVLPRDEVDSLVAACPYPADEPAVHAYITLASDPTALDGLLDTAAALAESRPETGSSAETEHMRLSPMALAWRCPKGSTLDAPISKASAKPAFKATTTTRNLRTLLKVQAAFA